MRKPQTWFDKSLLEDEPFLSAFKARQLAAPPTRRGVEPAGEDDIRNLAIAKELIDMKLLDTVQAWLDLAFEPHYCMDNWQRVLAEKEPKVICLFVQFYWTLSHDFENAIIILQTARKKRDYGYFLELKLPGDTLVSTAGLTKQVPPKQTFQIGDDAQSPSVKVPGSIPRGLKFKKNLDAKKDVPGCPEREGKGFSQTCPPSLDPTSLSATRQIESNPSALQLPPDSRNTTLICDLAKKRKSRQISPDRRRIKHQKINEATSDTSKLCNVSQIRKDVVDEKTKAPSRREDISDKADHVSNGALCGQPPLKKNLFRSIPHFLKFKKHPDAKKDVRSCPEREGKSSSQTCPPPLDPTSLSVTREIEINPCTLPLPPDSQNTSDLPKPRKRQNSPDIPRKRHQRINEATSDAGTLGGNNNFEPQSQEWSYFEVSLSCPPVASNAPVPKIHDPQRGVEDYPAQGKQKSRSNFRATKKTPRPKDAARQPKQYGTTSNPKKRRASSSEGHQLKRQEVQVDQEDPVPIIVQPDLAKKTRGRSSKVKEGQEGSSSITVQPAPGKKKCRPPKSQAQLNAWTAVPFSGQNVDMTQETSMTGCIPAQRKRQEVPGKQEDYVPIIVQPDLARMKQGGRPQKVEEGQEGSASITMQPAPGRKNNRPLESQAQLNAPFSSQNIDMTQETSITPCIPFFPAQLSHTISGLQENVERLSCYDYAPWSIMDIKEEEIMNRSGNWLRMQEYGRVEESFNLDCEAPAATQMEDRPTDIFPTQKPPLCVNPPIWAQSRQEVCETFDWFRSYQGGVYFAHNAVKGYLLSAFSSKRDRFEHCGKLIISHGGGKSESIHTRKGQTTVQPATDQLAQDRSVRALLNNYRNQRPLVLLIDDKYALFPYDLGVKDMTYVVLGFYTIAHAWAEYQPTTNGTGHVVRYKFAFRWCDDQGSPWWLTDKETNLSDLPPPFIPTSFSFKPTSKRKPRKLLNNGGIISEKQSENGEGAVLHTTIVRETVSHEPKSSVCKLCHMDSPRVYAWAWLCLHPDCNGFWKDIEGNSPPENLEYDLDFLKLMASLPVPPDFGKLKPDPPPRLSTDGTVTSYAFTRGFHCNSCGRLSCRFKWEKWECSNCQECLPVFRPPHKAKDFWSNLLPIGYKDHFVSKKSKIEQQPVRSFRHENGMGSIQSFILPDGRGKIHHIQPGTPLGRLEADDIFIEYQQQATAGELKFRRWPLRSHKCRGALLTNYFSQNSGEPYQYVGGAANSVPFENAPGAVVKARTLIQKRIWQALGKHIEFNEILSAAYMERQKMAFHSDNEIGLGPVVAGLSLGSPALMHFRINAKYDRLRELKGNLLSFVLRHGDILVMDGGSVQKYYEHTVIPNNFRIAATARHITPAHV